MNLLVNLVLLATICAATTATNATQPQQQNQNTTQSKAKRTISDLHNYGETKPVLLLVDNVASPSSNIPTFYAQPKPLILKPVFETEVPKHVAAQQVLYEFQQTPTNAVSNVHVNQLFQPYEFTKEPTNGQQYSTEAPAARQQYVRQNVPPNQLIQTSETIASPVQHSALINHGQNYAQVHFAPSIPPVGTPQHIQTQHYIPGKYLYVNGKILYQPAPLVQQPNVQQHYNQNYNQQGNQHHQNQQLQQQPHHAHQNQNQNSLTNTAPQTYGHNQNIYQNPNYQNSQKRPVSYITYNQNPRLPKPNLTPPPKAPAVGYSKFQPPAQLQPITKPMPSPAPVDEEEDEAEEDERAPLKDEDEAEESDDDESEEGERSSYKYDDDDRDESYEDRPSKYYSKYSFDDDDSDHQGYHQDEEESEDDEDSHRGSSKLITTKTKKHPKRKSKSHKSPKYNKSGKYNYSEGYRTKTEFETPKEKSSKKHSKKNKPTLKYKSVKYTQHGGKPKVIETIEGRQSQVVPVIEKRKIFQESWVVSKSTDTTS